MRKKEWKKLSCKLAFIISRLQNLYVLYIHLLRYMLFSSSINFGVNSPELVYFEWHTTILKILSFFHLFLCSISLFSCLFFPSHHIWQYFVYNFIFNFMSKPTDLIEVVYLLGRTQVKILLNPYERRVNFAPARGKDSSYMTLNLLHSNMVCWYKNMMIELLKHMSSYQVIYRQFWWWNLNECTLWSYWYVRLFCVSRFEPFIYV